MPTAPLQSPLLSVSRTAEALVVPGPSRQLAPIVVRVNDTKVLINALDLLEEQRSLHDAEAALRRRAIQGLQDLNSE